MLADGIALGLLRPPSARPLPWPHGLAWAVSALFFSSTTPVPARVHGDGTRRGVAPIPRRRCLSWAGLRQRADPENITQTAIPRVHRSAFRLFLFVAQVDRCHPEQPAGRVTEHRSDGVR